MWTSAELKMRAKGAFQKNYWSAVLVGFVMAIFGGSAGMAAGRASGYSNAYEEYQYYWGGGDSLAFAAAMMIVAAVAGIIGLIFFFLDIFVGNVLKIGGCRFFIMNQTENPSAGMLGFGFKSGNYGKLVLTMFLKQLYEGLWTLLFIVPGIIKHYEYLMIPYILAENPEMERQEAFLISKRMMMGQKMNAFVLDLTFIGWRILEMLSFGIVGIFYSGPYYEATIAELYSVNRTMAYQNGYIR